MDPKRLLPLGDEQKEESAEQRGPGEASCCGSDCGAMVLRRDSIVSPRGHLGRTDCDRWLQKGNRVAWRLTEQVHGYSNHCHHSALAVTDPRSPSADPELSGFVGHTSIE